MPSRYTQQLDQRAAPAVLDRVPIASSDYLVELITGATAANPVVITSVGHGFDPGDRVYIFDVDGMTQLNEQTYTVGVVTANTFQLSGVNGTGFTAYAGGGKAIRGRLQYADVEDLIGLVDLSAIESDIDSLEGRMTTAEGEIDALQAADLLLDGRLDSLETSLPILTGRVDAAELDIDDLETSVATLGSNLTTLSGRVDVAEDAIDDHEIRITDLENLVDGFDLTALEARVDALEAEDIVLDGRLDTAEADIAALEAYDLTVETRLDTAEADILALEAVDVAYDGRLDALEAEDIVLDGRLDAAEADIVVLEGADVLLDGRLDVLEATRSGFNYKFNDATSGDAGSGKFRFDNATLGSVTQLAIHPTDDDGNDLTDWIGTWDNTEAAVFGYVTIREAGVANSFVIFQITGTAAAAGSSLVFAGSIIDSGGTFSNNDETFVAFAPSGVVPTRLVTAEGEIDALQAADIVLDGRLDTAEADIDALELDVADHETRITDLEALVGDLDVTALEARVDALEAYDLTVETRLDDLEADVLALQTNLAIAESDIDDLEADVASILADYVSLTPATSSRNLIVAQNATTSPLAVKGAGSQSAALLRILNSSDALLAAVLSSGDFAFASARELLWSSTAAADGTADFGFARDAAGVGRVTNGSTGVGLLRASQFIAYNSANNDVRIQSAGIDLKSAGIIGFATSTDATGSHTLRLQKFASQANTLHVTNGSGGAGFVYASQMYVDDGSVSSPGFFFVNETNMGLYRIGSGQLGLVTAGVARANIGVSGGSYFFSGSTTNPGLVVRGASAHTGTIFDVQASGGTKLMVVGAAGSIALQNAAVFNWSGSAAADGTADTGLKRNTGGRVQVTDGSTGVGEMIASRYYGGNGDSSNPTYTFYNDAANDTGLYLRTADSWAATAGGTRRFICNNSPWDLYVDNGFRIAAGTFVNSFQSISLASGSTTNNWSGPTAGVVEVSTGGGTANVTGLNLGATAGQIIIFVKDGAGTLGLLHADAGSSAGNRFAVVGAVNLSLGNHAVAVAVYNGTNWKVGRCTV